MTKGLWTSWCYNALTVAGPAEAVAAFGARVPTAADLMGELYETGAKPGVPFEEMFAPWPPDEPPPSHPQMQAQDIFFERVMAELHGEPAGAAGREPDVCSRASSEPGAAPESGRATARSEPDPASAGQVLRYRFLSAWSPPDSTLARLVQAHPRLEFTLTYAERSAEVAGVARYVNGQLLETVDLLPEEAFPAADDDISPGSQPESGA